MAENNSFSDILKNEIIQPKTQVAEQEPINVPQEIKINAEDTNSVSVASGNQITTTTQTETPPTVPNPSPVLQNVVDFVDVCLKFGDFTLFDNLQFCIPDFVNEGQFISILGRSGCGKSQIAKLISGLKKPTSGEVRIYGVTVNDKTSVPMVFQQYSSYPWKTVRKNVELPMKLKGVPRAERKQRALELLKLVGLEGQDAKWPRQLSGGQLQRVSLARNLAANSQIMILDEATSALDIFSKRDMQNALLDIYYNSDLDPTIINITHDISEAVMLSNRIIVMQANPSKVYKTFDIKFDGKRTQDIRNTPQFSEYVKQIEQAMNEVSKS